MASNHLSIVDPPAVGVASPRRVSYMARHDLFSSRFSSWWLNSVGAFPVKRDSADLSAVKQAIRCVKGGRGLLLFPEGTRQEPGKSDGEPEAGVGFLAAKLGVPVIPVWVKGTDQAWPKGAKFLKSARVTVRFGKQIPIERRMPYSDIAKTIMDEIRHLS